MRRIAALFVLAICLTAFGGLAGSASADMADATYTSQSSPSYGSGVTCTTVFSTGVWSSGVSGFYYDGCTARVGCFAIRGCAIHAETGFDLYRSSAIMTSQNARVRRFTSTGALRDFYDTSCYRSTRCSTTTNWEIGYMQSATIQCNGVAYTTATTSAHSSCTIFRFNF